MGFPRGSNPSDCVDLARVLRGRPRPNGARSQHNTCYGGVLLQAHAEPAGTPSPDHDSSSILPIGISTIGLA